MKIISLIMCIVGASNLGCSTPRLAQPAVQHGLAAYSTHATICPERTSEPLVHSGTIEHFVELGLSRNPRIQAAQHKIEAIRYRIPQALALPDPVVNTSTHLAPVQTAAGEQAFALGIMQKFTNSQRRATQAAMISEEVIAAQANLTGIELEIAEQVRSACYQLMFVRREIEITQEDESSLSQIASVVERQYEVQQQVTQQDVLNIQIEQSKVENRLTVLQQSDASFQARLARLIHVAPDSSLEIQDRFQSATQPFDVDELIARAIGARPDLRAQLANIRRDQKNVDLAQLQSKPDFTVGLNWIATSTSGISPVANGDDALVLGIGFNLPVYKNRIRAGVCEAHANQKANQSKLASIQDNVAEEIFDLVAKLESSKNTLSLVQEDILPKSQRTLDIAIDEYATGSVSYVQLIENWRGVLRYRIAEANLQSQYSQLLASLARSVGQLEPISPQLSIPQPAIEPVNQN